jgi:hypothetical protein
VEVAVLCDGVPVSAIATVGTPQITAHATTTGTAPSARLVTLALIF